MDNILISEWGISSDLIINEAKKIGLETGIVSRKNNLFWIKEGSKKVYFKSIDCGLNSSFGLKSANDKEITYSLSEEQNIRVPKSIYINRDEITNFDYKNIGITFPVISKPIDGAHGDGVALNIDSIEKLKLGIKYSFENKNTKRVVIQEQIKGEDHRFFVVGDNVISITKRIPPYIIGNGKNTIIELIEIENKNSKRGNGHDNIMTYIKIDDELKNTVNESGYDLTSVLEKDKKIFVRKNANLSSGGLAIDMTDIAHESTKKEAIKVAKLLNLRVCGVDIFSTDISKSLKETGGAIIEVNATPGIRMHHFPSKGKGRNVALEIIKLSLSGF